MELELFFQQQNKEALLKEVTLQHPNPTTIYLTRWNWDYAEALQTQMLCVDFVRQYRDQKILIFCSHPHVFTMGRGLQKGSQLMAESLIEFNPNQSLPFPLYHIKRGGGLTFHYPGQWICYPIINLNHPDWNLSKVVDFLLNQTAQTLQKTFNLPSLPFCKKPLIGLWMEHQGSLKKIASLGLAASHFVTYHGLALNLEYDPKMFSQLASLHPCGLSSTEYLTLEEYLRKGRLRETFHQIFLQFCKTF